MAIVFERRGTGTDWLAQRECGEYLDVLGFLGNGFTMKPEGRYLLVGGGIGVPPMRGCAQYTMGRSTAILGFRTAQRAILLDQFKQECDQVAGGHRRRHHGPSRLCGRLLRQVLEKDKDFTAVLACGPKLMLRSVWKVAKEFGSALPGVHGGADGLRRGRLSGLRYLHGRRHHEARL